jgi:probable F420-dependent oxidoreductase
MKVGAALRSMGPESTPGTLLECARAAENAGLDGIWVTDHIAIPPDDAEGSGGRYLDPLTALGWLGGATQRIGLGTAVLILPYRPLLPTAKAIATVQELSGGRLRLGVGVGWMEPEFRAVGVSRSQRGRITDETLDFLHRCFASDEVEANDQRFLFLPRPERPPFYVGGAPPHALDRVVRHADGWLPMGGDPAKLAPHIATLREKMDEAGRPPPEVVLLTALPLNDPAASIDLAGRLIEAGVTQLIYGSRYANANEFRKGLDLLASDVLPHLPQSDPRTRA